MFRLLLLASFLAVTPCIAEEITGITPGKPSKLRFTRSEVKAYSEMQKKLYPDKGDLFAKLVERFTDKDEYKGDEVTAITNPKIAMKRMPLKPKQRHGAAPRDTFPSGDAIQNLRLAQKRSPKNEDYPKHLIARYGEQPWYTAEELRDILENAGNAQEIQVKRPAFDPVGLVIAQSDARERTFLEGFRSPRIRRDWRDVLYEEDKSQEDAFPRSIGSLQGASLSLTRNNVQETDTWAAIGAMILPWRKRWLPSDRWHLDEVTVAPSISVNRVSSNGDPKGETDSVFYRLGVYASWEGVLGGISTRSVEQARDVERSWVPPYIPLGLQVRAAAVLATDTGHRNSLPGFELDLEPRIKLPFMPLGFRQVVWRKEPLKADRSDDSLLDFQLRAFLHVEGGSVQHAEAAWIPRTEDFFRIGPNVGFDFHAPRLGDHQSATLSFRYSHLVAVTGTLEDEYHFNASLTYNILDNPFTGHKVGLKAEYQKGILPFTAEEVDTFTVGLSVLF